VHAFGSIAPLQVKVVVVALTVVVVVALVVLVDVMVVTEVVVVLVVDVRVCVVRVLVVTVVMVAVVVVGVVVDEEVNMHLSHNTGHLNCKSAFPSQNEAGKRSHTGMSGTPLQTLVVVEVAVVVVVVVAVAVVAVVVVLDVSVQVPHNTGQLSRTPLPATESVSLHNCFNDLSAAQ
jgi:hypothetical protein